MLPHLKCCLIWIAGMATVSGFYAPMGALNTHALVLCDTLDADVAHLLGQTAPEYPSALAESRCVAINVCDEQNHRGEGVTRHSDSGLMFEYVRGVSGQADSRADRRSGQGGF